MIKRPGKQSREVQLRAFRGQSNSAYLSLLNQSDIELELLHRTLGISDTLLEYVHNVPPGCGLLKFGDKYIPKDNRLDKESKLYQLFNTNFHEKVEEKRR